MNQEFENFIDDFSKLRSSVNRRRIKRQINIEYGIDCLKEELKRQIDKSDNPSHKKPIFFEVELKHLMRYL